MAKKVMVVDDSNTVLSSVAGMLSDVYEVQTASDVKEAELLLKSGSPDLMLLDIEMPGMNGISFLKKLSKRGERGFPIVFLSSNSEHATVVKVAKMGAKGFIEKPFNKEKLLKKIEAWLENDANNG
jgi:DNA-binding response OmpR family regulator